MPKPQLQGFLQVLGQGKERSSRALVLLVQIAPCSSSPQGQPCTCS